MPKEKERSAHVNGVTVDTSAALFSCLSLSNFQGIPRLNTVFLTGYLGQDPKPKYFDSGKVVLNLSLAVKREYHPIEVQNYQTRTTQKY